MLPYEVIKAKRDGKTLDPAELRSFLADYTTGTIPDYQMSAFLMAVFFRGLADDELAAWTDAMLRSGEVVDLSDIPGAKVDKHSTGGVGDKVSICLAPLVAACGVRVPMISGRGLGHTGGTLDKLESIPGFKVDLSIDEYRRLVRTVGSCLIGQTATLVPADKKLYALRDVTATVECIPLIASSIMSKKLAEGIDALVLDVKVGSGAFMKGVDDARRLARTMVKIGAQMNRRVVALLTDMDQPLGNAIGNANEVAEAIEILKGRGPEDLRDLTLALGAEMLFLAGLYKQSEDAKPRLLAAINSGAALAKMKEIVSAQGGDAGAIDDASRLPTAKARIDVSAPKDGFVVGFDCEGIGRAAVRLGAGRQRLDSRVDPAVGFVLLKKRGDRIRRGEPWVQIHFNDSAAIDEVTLRLNRSITIATAKAGQQPLVLERVSTPTDR